MGARLRRVDDELAARTVAAAQVVGELLAGAIGAEGVLHASPMGSSVHPGCLTKGDIDVLVVATRRAWPAVIDELRSRGDVAQPDNWTEDFASFTLPGVAAAPVGIQLVAQGSAVHEQLATSQRLLADPDFRDRYDVAKQHAAELSDHGYWRTKDVFWHTLDAPGPSWTAATTPVLKVLTVPQWTTLLTEQETAGAPVDVADGFVHLSTPAQVDETVAKHFADQRDLWLLTLDADDLGVRLRWEPSRGGQLFPHLYGPLRLADVHLVRSWA